MGDFNMKREELESSLKPIKSGLQSLPIRGSGLTFHRKGSGWTDIDSIIVSPTAKSLLSNAKVLRNWSTGSDHFPLVSKMKPIEMAPKPPPAPVRFRFDRDLVKGHGHRLVCSNRWACLPVDKIMNEEELHESTYKFTKLINEKAITLGIKRQVRGKVFRHDRKLKRLLDHLAVFQQKWRESQKAGGTIEVECYKSYRMVQTTARNAISKREQVLHHKRVQEVSKLFHTREMKAFYNWEKKTTVMNANLPVGPIKEKNGSLTTDPEKIVTSVFQYFKELSQDGPEGLSRNKTFWLGRIMDKGKNPYQI
jgi:hypothetical protein